MNNKATAITLQIEGTQNQVTEESILGWEGEQYLLDGTTRGHDNDLPEIELNEDSVVELELENGLSILVTADDVERYLGSTGTRGADTGVLRVGKNLRFTGVRPPQGLARDSFGAWLIRGLKVFKQGPAAIAALAAAGTFQDALLDDHNGLFHCATDKWYLTPIDVIPESEKQILLFVHGTASSTAGSFQGLWEQGYNDQLAELYGSRIYALEHRTLTESPVANALAVIEKLPEGAVLHIVSHSRGGMIGELLARANRCDDEPITDAEIDRFLEHGQRTGRKGFEEDAKLLKKLNGALLKKKICVERFVRVACPARGTTLASGKLDRWATVMLNLLGKGIDAGTTAAPVLKPLSKGYNLLKSFLLAVVRERTDARILPGLEAMMPDSPLVALLNDQGVEVRPPLHVLAGDFQGDNLLTWLGDCVTEIFYGGATDLVVNTPSMSGGAMREEGIWEKQFIGSKVIHTRYFDHKDSSDALLTALQGDNHGFTRLSEPSRATISRSRGGKRVKKKGDAPIVFLLPGIMGSHIQVDRNRIWFDPFSMIGGEMEQLSIDSPVKITPDGWFDYCYEGFARFLSETHEVRPFVYDWRLSIADAAQKFGVKLDKALQDARSRRKPLRIIAHSMGGLVARLALTTRWATFKSIPGSRLLQLGTPNNGSHSIAAVLLGRDDFVQSIERWLDWKHDMREFLEIVAQFPGVLELLPWPTAEGTAIDGIDYFSQTPWKGWFADDGENNNKKKWLVPAKAPLDAAKQTVAELQKAEIDAQCSYYVAGHNPTPTGVKIVNGELGLEWTSEGDGRVLWKNGIPPGVPVWYTQASHGDLPRHQKAFDAYLQIIEEGNTNADGVSLNPPVARDTGKPEFIPRGLTSNALFPSAAEVMAAAVGGTPPGLRPAAEKVDPVRIKVIHGSIALADSPLLLGCYVGDGVRGSARFVDRHLNGSLTRAYDLGRYPTATDEAMVFYHPKEQGKPAGAIVVGLGSLGELTPGALTHSLTGGLLEYVRCEDQKRSGKGCELNVSSLLVGSGFIGLTIEVVVRCQLEALKRANSALGAINSQFRIATLTMYEEVLDRAINAVEAIKDLVCETQYSKIIDFHGRLESGRGGYRGRAIASGGFPGMYRVHITSSNDLLNFTLITDRARNSVEIEANQQPVVEGLIRSATQRTHNQKGLSRTLFELLVPNDMKGAVADLRTLMLSVDKKAAVYPWELMRDAEEIEGYPLSTRVELIRQLASDQGRERVQTVQSGRVLVIGDTQSGLARLKGAQQEAKEVAAKFRHKQYDVKDVYEASAQDVFVALFDCDYQFMHLAGHGVVDGGYDNNSTGMVLQPGVCLTSSQVEKMRRVPEFVFINCCHLGSMAEDAKPRWGKLAANLATQFIEMGCKAVIAAGWAVDDLAANTFATEFYDKMLDGVRFGRAVQLARFETFRQHRGKNTWGAFQAYGDEQYRFPGKKRDEEFNEDYVHPDHLIADLDLLTARLGCAVPTSILQFYTKRIEKIEILANRSNYFNHGRVREKFGDAWKALGEKKRTINHYRAALGLEDGEISLHAIEQLSNIEIRYGAELITSLKNKEQGLVYLEAGIERLEALINLGKTGERLSLLGSAWKRRAETLLKSRKTGALNDALIAMTKAYDEAAEFTYAQTGSRDYYPMLNALDGAFLCAVRGEKELLEKYQNNLDTLLKEAAENAASRNKEKPDFFHALAKVEIDRVRALYRCLDQKSEENITTQEVQDKLIRQYRSEMKSIGSASEHDSVTSHLAFLIGALPTKAKGKIAIKTEPVTQGLQNISAGVAEK